MPTLVLDEPKTKGPRLVLDEPKTEQPTFDMPPRILNLIAGGEKQIEDLLSPEDRDSFRKILEMSDDPDEERMRLGNVLYFSNFFNKPPSEVHILLDDIIDTTKFNPIAEGPKTWNDVAKHGYGQMELNAAKSFAGIAKMVGEFITPSTKAMENAVFPALNKWEKEQGEKITEWSDMMLAGLNEYYKRHPEETVRLPLQSGFLATLTTYMFNPKVLVQSLIESSPMMLEGILGTVAGGPVGGIALMATPITGEVYASAREEGTEPLPAMAQAILTGVGEGIIEQWTLSRKLGLFKNWKSMVSKGLPKVLWEGNKAFWRGTAEEGSQEFNRNFWQWAFTDRSQAWFENVERSMGAGGIMEAVMAGGFMAVGVVGTPVSKDEKLGRVDKIRDAVNENIELSDEHKVEINKELDKVTLEINAGVYELSEEQIKARQSEIVKDIFPDRVKEPIEKAKPVAPTEIEALAKELEKSLNLTPERALEVAAKKLAYDALKAAERVEKPPVPAVQPSKPAEAPKIAQKPEISPVEGEVLAIRPSEVELQDMSVKELDKRLTALELDPEEYDTLAAKRQGIRDWAKRPAEPAVEPAKVEKPITVYRTEKAHPAYKGKKVWGKGRYFALKQESAGEMQLDPERTIVEEWTPEMGGVETYQIPKGTKLKTIDITKMSNAEFNAMPRGEKLRKQVLAEGFDGIKLLTGDDLNLGGDQIVIYRPEALKEPAVEPEAKVEEEIAPEVEEYWGKGHLITATGQLGPKIVTKGIKAKPPIKGKELMTKLYDAVQADEIKQEEFIELRERISEVISAEMLKTRAVGKLLKEQKQLIAEAPTFEEVEQEINAAIKAKPKVEPEAKRIISKDAYEKAKKRLRDNTTLRTGVDPRGLADLVTIGAYHFETGVRTFGAWSKKMVEEFGEIVKPYLRSVWNQIQAPKEDTQRAAQLRQQIYKEATEKGLTKKLLDELKQKHTGYKTISGKLASKNITTEQLEELLKAVKKERPKRVGHRQVITEKTEKKIASLKSSLKRKLQMTDEAYAEILQREVQGREPRYIDAKRFITEEKGKEIIKRMHDAAEVIKVTQPYEDAIAKNEEISAQVKRLRAEIAQKTKRDPWRTESMRYYAQQSEAKVNAPIFSMYMSLLDTNLKVHKSRHARMMALESQIPGFKNIASDEEALARVAQYIASQSNLKDKPAPPVDITQAETKLAKEIQRIFREYELKARVSKFFNWYYYDEAIAQYDQFKKEIHRAEDIFESQGREELIDYLKTQTWGVIRSGYEPLENVIMKIRPWTPRPTTVGKGHIKIRTDIEYHKQERNILQRLNSYMRQMDMLYNLSPQINAFVRLYEDNMSKFSNPGNVIQSVELFLRNLKRYNIQGEWIGDAMARMYAQASQIIIMAQPVLAFRNTFQNAAFEHDKSILFDPRNESLTPEEIEYTETYVQQMRPMMEEYFMINERALPGTKTLMKILRKIKIYAHSDVLNRHWGFWAKINQVKRAVKDSENVEEMMDYAKFEDITELEQIRALGILAKDGEEEMARYVSRVHVDDIHFLYERAQRSPAEMGPLGRVMGNLMLFPRAYAEKLAHAVSKLTSPTSSMNEKYRAAKILVSVMAGGTLVGAVYTMMTGRKRNPYNPFDVLSFRLGGLMIGLVEDVNETYTMTLRALRGDKRALYSLTTILPRMADLFIPFYDWTLRGLEAVTDTKNIDRSALRSIYESIDKEYKRRKGAYKMKRDLVEALQYVFAGPSVDKKIEERKSKRQPISRGGIKRGVKRKGIKR